MSTLKNKICLAIISLFSATALANSNSHLSITVAQNNLSEDATTGGARATHIKAKTLDDSGSSGGSEMDGGGDGAVGNGAGGGAVNNSGRNPSTTEGLPYPDEEVKSSDPINPNSGNKNMPVDQD